MKIWMEVTRDKYELPVRVADSIKQLAALAGIKEMTIYKAISRDRSRGTPPRYICVKLEEDDDEV